jgi:hypothetical protein
MNDNRTIKILISIVLISYFVIAVLMLKFGFFEYDKSDSSAKLVGASLTLVGCLVTTMVTLFGYIIKLSIDHNNSELQKEAEKRLKLDAAIKAVTLLGTESGGDTSLMQRTGALFALARLGLNDLAIDLVRFMYTEKVGNIGPYSMSSLLDIALQSNDLNAQKKAGEFLRDQYDSLFSDEGFEWPECISNDWPQELDYSARYDALQGLMCGIMARPRVKWEDSRLFACASYLAIAFEKEQDPHLKANIAVFLKEFLTIFNQAKKKVTKIYLPKKDLDIKTLLIDVSQIDEKQASDPIQRLVGNLREWLCRDSINAQRNSDDTDSGN